MSEIHLKELLTFIENCDKGRGITLVKHRLQHAPLSKQLQRARLDHERSGCSRWLRRALDQSHWYAQAAKLNRGRHAGWTCPDH